MSKTEQSKTTYNKKAQDYDNTFDGRFTHLFKQELVNAVRLKPSVVVLDVACGNGDLLGRLSGKIQIKGYGIDISENMIVEAKKRHPHFEFTVSGCDELPFENGVFDVITVSASFHHFENPDNFLREAVRVLKQGGDIYIAEIYLPGPLRFISNLFLPLLKSGDMKIYSPKELEVLLYNNGFSGVKTAVKERIQLVRGGK